MLRPEPIFDDLHYQLEGQTLKINIGDMVDPKMEPLKRHRDSLQKKCGLGEEPDDVKLLSKWGWLSLITKTNNKEKAQNQQCHYDYFKEANDKENT